MLHIRQSAARPASDAVLRSMFAARKSVFVDLLKWDVPVLADSYEIDQYDDAHATYLILADPDGTHLGSARLLPTTGPHILGDFYPDLCEQAPPQAPDIQEITRFCLDRRLRAAERRQVRDTLVTALVDHALAHGIIAYSAIAEMGWLQQILAFGWHCTPLGPPRRIDGTMLGALRIDIASDTKALLAERGIVASPLRIHQRVAA
ncbi:acyl-homoserine-lactone synthase [Sphingobium sp. CR2-8]|uniref:acyl-homoserine-lactone synthase n=1 Tax=Sphingobium sp. CR2-8 TaxID=1306534 RepID=UPI002DBE2672|nr:acyl-homoserine-lactone synthase [Sphingobium sp. CR2-8]MEC3910576.1 acyl-homoserine-lactone synthase [Sphingobium sp. CR2-8]